MTSVSSKPVIEIASQAGAAILQHLQPGLEVSVKSDESLVSEADLAAHQIVTEGLQAIDPSIPVLSEEGTPEEKQAAHQSTRRWVVDPLDGSRTSIEYAKGKKDEDGFGVHIALIENNQPVLGVAFFPAKGEGGTLYFTGDDGRAYRQQGDHPPKPIHTHKGPPRDPMKAAVSWREGQRPESILGREVEHIPEVGGGRICITAEGTTDIAHIDRHFSHWDVAAAHAILRAAGGELVDASTHEPVQYDNEALLLPPCFGANTEKLRLLGLGSHLPRADRQRSGFTLVELAIVLVIIGLIVGGILAGSVLIRNAEIRAIIQEKNEYEAAINTFRLRYKALPGDMQNATEIWGARDPDQMTCLTTPTVGTATCNGLGDKRIWNVRRANMSGVQQMTELLEALLAWQHLSNAELIKASLSGNRGAGAGFLNLEIGNNAPTSRISEGTWLLEYLGDATPAFTAAAAPHLFPGQYAQIFAYGVPTPDPNLGNAPYGAIVTTSEAMILDQKIDDGRPGMGILKGLAPVASGNPYANNCATSGDPATAEYNTAVDSNECPLIFKLKF